MEGEEGMMGKEDMYIWFCMFVLGFIFGANVGGDHD